MIFLVLSLTLSLSRARTHTDTHVRFSNLGFAPDHRRSVLLSIFFIFLVVSITRAHTHICTVLNFRVCIGRFFRFFIVLFLSILWFALVDSFNFLSFWSISTRNHGQRLDEGPHYTLTYPPSYVQLPIVVFNARCDGHVF
ncbi:hypothetical protein ACP275_13G158100 [Erythranthe tilingii]